MTIRSISYGGGVQSSALVVLAAQGKINFDVALFANTGDDSEHPKTLAYVRDIMTPWAAANGLPIHELRKEKDGQPVSIRQRVLDDNYRQQVIPVRGENGMPLSRVCTVDWKVKVVARWLKEHGATRDNPATVAIGISTDEAHRANTKKAEPVERIVYPLIDLNLNRADCAQIIADAGLPVPPKSSCWFCPFHSLSYWSEMRRDEPGLFWASVEFEKQIQAKEAGLGRRPVYLTSKARPLDEVVQEAQANLFDPESFELSNAGECDEGYCFV